MGVRAGAGRPATSKHAFDTATRGRADTLSAMTVTAPATDTAEASDASEESTPADEALGGDQDLGGDAAATDSTGEVMIVTDTARAAVIEIRDREDDAEALALRVEITGAAGIDYAYDLSLEPLAEAVDDDHIHSSGGLTVVVPAASVSRLRGATLDVPSIAGQGGLVIRNPNRPNPLGEMGRLELTGDTADKVRQLLDMSINPALASHGGYASLLEVKDDNSVVVTMGGGCQGCAMSQATLSEGIRRAILEAVPEVTDVIDATDHSAGDNPYFT